jgi:hypothetical protein
MESGQPTVIVNDRARILAATTELQQASHAMAEALYKASQGSGGGHASRQGSDAPSDVKEGEVVEA